MDGAPATDPWDLTTDPALRDALIDALADALVAEVERQERSAQSE